LLVRGTSIVRLPRELPLEVACPASCATATVAAVLQPVTKFKGRSILVFGAGMLGLTACAMAKTRGCDSILCVDLDPHRRDLALAFGADESIAPEGVFASVERMTDGKGFDYALELTGANASFITGLQATRMGGTLVSAGAVFPSDPIELVVERLTRRNLTIVGVHNYRPSDLLTAVEFLTEHHQRFPFASLVAQWYSLPRIAEAFSAAKEKANIRVGIKMGML
jgi:alcohol dehydrogenase